MASTKSTKSVHKILILGTHHAGINAAHYLLKHTIPKLEALTPTTSYHITIVGPNTEFFWNVAAPRHLANESQFASKDLYYPIAEHFKTYDASKFKFILGKATALNPETKTVTIKTNAGPEETVSYATLVVATGSTYASPLWSINDSETANKEAFTSTRAALKKAKTVLIAGGGAIGVETAGEIGHFFHDIHTTLLSGDARLLPRLLPGTSHAAETRLKKLRVAVVHNVRVKESKVNADGTTTLSLDNGEEKTVDVYIDATGPRPNTSFLPKSWLNERGAVLVDKDTLRASFPGGAGVYAIGDVGSYSDGALFTLKGSFAPLGTSIGIDIAKAAGKERELGLEQKAVKIMAGTQFVPTGPGGGVAQVMGWRLPSLFVWLVKSRNFLVWMAPASVSGANVAKA